MPNGNRFLKAYLVNSTNSKADIHRYDATVRSVTTEILVDGEWRLLQVKHAPTCGNGYWKMSLEPGHFIALHVDHMIGGTAEVKFRVRDKTPDYDLTSNQVTCFIRDELLPSAGTVPTYADRDP